MIDAGFFREDDGFRLIITGHANHAPCGQDIVCASVSVLFFAAAGYLKTLKGAKCRIVKIQSGYAELTCTGVGEEALRMACIGILQVAEQFPECVSVCNKIWRSRLTTLDAETASPSLKSGVSKGGYMYGRRNFFGRFCRSFKDRAARAGRGRQGQRRIRRADKNQI